ncbi:sporulation and spore germination protein [Nocardiopsis sp. Huas11]|uniref:LpqB family beta-propeller domain-containing protein n=1 Tax=Nocardiopsis sp. Huas11 TaxID=2183912 RepID=UPI000F202352|nr:LpqB family beta-propeller domain-containing protein [Nocardiopsis sp. Huas11]RKS05354.1 sporulation and spore germination protein [Nocardiopsis sp. Huas11]
MSAPTRTPRAARRGRAVRALVAASAACAVLASCATVPMTGPVVPGDGGDTPSDPYGGYVRLLPAGPQEGVGPEGLVGGFLKDMGSFEEDHKAARSYMFPSLSEEWSPDGSVRVFGDLDAVGLDTEVGADGLTATVRMRSSLMATIDDGGKYVQSDAGHLLEVPFELAREGGDPEGEWRIQDMPDELILSQLDVERTHRPFNLYYFNPEGTALVPDPVYLPVSNDELAERLLNKLVAGPTDWLAPAVDSAFPEGVGADVEIDAETAIIRVDGVGQVDEFEMAAQIAWTLRQLPEVEEFTLVVNGDEVPFPDSGGDSNDRPRPASEFWSSVSPNAISAGIHAYFTHDGQLWSAADWASDTIGDAERVPGPLGAGDVQLENFAVSVDESTIAGITVGGGEVVTAFASPGAEVSEVLSDGVFTSLSWDVNGDLWVTEQTSDPEEAEEDSADEDERAEDEPVDEETPTDDGPAPEPGTTDLWLLRDGDEVVSVDLSDLRDRSLVNFQISRDGTRAAVITEVDGETSLQVGRVVSDSDGRVSVGSFITLGRELDEITDISWRSGDQLAVLGNREGGTGQAFLVSLDGGTPAASAGTPVPGMVNISGAPGQPLIAGSDDGNIWITTDRLNWQSAVEGGSPTFPG